MATTVNIHNAKTQLSRLLARVGEGEEIIIAKAGKPVALLSPLKGKMKTRKPVTAKGKISISKDFEKPLPKHLKSFSELKILLDTQAFLWWIVDDP